MQIRGKTGRKNRPMTESLAALPHRSLWFPSLRLLFLCKLLRCSSKLNSALVISAEAAQSQEPLWQEAGEGVCWLPYCEFEHLRTPAFCDKSLGQDNEGESFSRAKLCVIFHLSGNLDTLV